MKIIPLRAVPNQRFTFSNGQDRWVLEIKVAISSMICNLWLNDEPVLLGSRIVAGVPIIWSPRLATDGNFGILTEGGEEPWWEQFGTSQKLVFLESDMAIASTRFVDFRSRNISPSLTELTALANTAMKIEDIGYYPPTWQALQEAISYALSVVRSHAPEQGQILLATQMLTSAMGGLIEFLEVLIRTLYGSGEQGVMYIPKPQVLGQQVLWQDVEGTVPVVDDGDPVGLMLDLSGNGNHASQSTSASRPIYRTDGVLHWLQPDGVDDTMSTSSPVDLSGESTSTIFTAIEKTAGVSREVIIGSNLDADDSIAAASPESATHGVATVVNPSGSGQSGRVSGFTSSQKLVTTHITDFLEVTTADRYTIRVNGQSQSMVQFGSSTPSSSQGNLVVNLFSRPGSHYFNGKFYGGIIVSGVPDGVVIPNAESYFARMAGVTL